MRSIIPNHTIALFQLTRFNYRQRRSLVNLPDWKNVLILDVLVKLFWVAFIDILFVKQIFERIWRVYIIYFLRLPIWYIVSNNLINYKLQEINIIWTLLFQSFLDLLCNKQNLWLVTQSAKYMYLSGWEQCHYRLLNSQRTFR